jgi:hypothetical protein
MSEEGEYKKVLLEYINKKLELLNNKGFTLSLLTMEKLDELILEAVLTGEPVTLKHVENLNKIGELVGHKGFMTFKDAEETRETLVKLVDNKHIN